MSRLVVAGLVVAALGLASEGRAFSQPADPAEEKFQRGRALLAEGKYSAACKEFTESQRDDPASGTLLALAYCQELSGLVASAWTNYRAAAELAQREGQAERHAAASERQQEMAQRVSYLTIVVPENLSKLDGFRITLDGVELSAARYGVPVPIDGGTHLVETAGPGRPTWTAVVRIEAERDKQMLTVQVVAPTGPPRATPSATADLTAQPGSAARGVPPVALGLAVASGVGLGLGIGFSAVATSKNHDSSRDGHCTAAGCDPSGTELRNDALTAADVATWSFVAAGVCATTALVVYLTDWPSNGRRATRLRFITTPTAARLDLDAEF